MVRKFGFLFVAMQLKSRPQEADDTFTEVAARLGPFADCTSNQVCGFSKETSGRTFKWTNMTDILQAEAYTELLNPRHAPLLKRAAALGKELTRDAAGGHGFKNVPETELAVEIAVRFTHSTMCP